jgi:hypothetical protein
LALPPEPARMSIFSLKYCWLKNIDWQRTPSRGRGREGLSAFPLISEVWLRADKKEYLFYVCTFELSLSFDNSFLDNNAKKCDILAWRILIFSQLLIEIFLENNK